MSKPVPAVINKRNWLRFEKWRPTKTVIRLRRPDDFSPDYLANNRAAKAANDAIDWVRFRSKLCG